MADWRRAEKNLQNCRIGRSHRSNKQETPLSRRQGRRLRATFCASYDPKRSSANSILSPTKVSPTQLVAFRKIDAHLHRPNTVRLSSIPSRGNDSPNGPVARRNALRTGRPNANEAKPNALNNCRNNTDLTVERLTENGPSLATRLGRLPDPLNQQLIKLKYNRSN